MQNKALNDHLLYKAAEEYSLDPGRLLGGDYFCLHQASLPEHPQSPMLWCLYNLLLPSVSSVYEYL